MLQKRCVRYIWAIMSSSIFQPALETWRICKSLVDIFDRRITCNAQNGWKINNCALFSFDIQLGLRDNQLIDLPREIGELARLRELHIQNNRLTVLPPEVGEFVKNYTVYLMKLEWISLFKWFICWKSGFLDLQTNKSVLKMEENEWLPQIQEQYLLGINHVLDYIQTEAYRMWVLKQFFFI